MFFSIPCLCRSMHDFDKLSRCILRAFFKNGFFICVSVRSWQYALRAAASAKERFGTSVPFTYWSGTNVGFFAIEPSAAVSQGKLTNPLIALLVITECSWSRSVKPRRFFKLTSVLSPGRQVKERFAKAFLAESQRIRAASGRTTSVQVHFLHVTDKSCLHGH